MTRKCAFRGCISGSVKERNRNKEHGVPNISLFRFPDRFQHPEIRKKWEDVLGREARDHETVCALHFQKEDLQPNYEVILANGTKFTMERGRISINPKAVPQAKIRTTEDQEKDVQSPQPSGKISNLPSPSEQSVSPPRPLQTSSEIEKRDPLFCDTDSVNSWIKMETDSSSETDDKGKMERFGNISNLLELPRVSPLDIKNHSLPAETLNPQNSQFIFCKTEIEETPNSPFIICKTEIEETSSIEDEIDSNVKPSVTLSELRRQLENAPLPHGWKSLLLKNSILIGHFTTVPAKKELVIHRDGGIQIFFNKTIVYVDGILPGTNVDNVLKNIDILQPLLLCDGLGIAERFHSACDGYVQPNHSYVKTGRVRCMMCQKERLKILRAETQNSTQSLKMQEKMEEVQRNFRNAKRKISSLKKRVLTLKNSKKR